MIRIAVWHGDMSDSYLRRMVQLGADCLDFGQGGFWPGVAEKGYPDLDQVKTIRRRVRDFGLDINRVTLPDMTDEFAPLRSLPKRGFRSLASDCREIPFPG
jgi:mannonate dehydratase